MKSTFLNARLIATVAHAHQNRIPLDKEWQIQSSSTVTESGEQLSQPAYEPKNWYAVKVPTTAVGYIG